MVGSASLREPAPQPECGVDPVWRAPAASEEPPEPLDFERVYADHFAFIWRSVRGLGVPLAAAEDVTQDVFVIVHRKLPDVQEPAAVRSWLFGVARRVCKDQRRAAGRRGPHLELDTQREVDPGQDPQQRAQARIQLQAVERFAEGLDEEHRALFFLALVEGLSVADVAQTLGWNANTTYSRVRVLRQQLAESLEARAPKRGTDGRAG